MLKNFDDGSLNVKYIDLLEEDKPIANQKFVCVSFVSPENILKKKELYFFEKFLNNWDLNKSMEKFTGFLNFISFKYNINYQDILNDFDDFKLEEQKKISQQTLLDDYKNFLDAHENSLENQFNESNKFQTSVRGLKIRGVFSTQKEAEERCKLLRQNDPNHDVFVVGRTMDAMGSDAYKTGKVEYLEDELNQLMREKSANELKAKNEFEKRVKETKENAIKENIIKAKENNNKLSQSIDKDGNLFKTTEDNINISSASIKEELFNSENLKIGSSSINQLDLDSKNENMTLEVVLEENTEEDNKLSLEENNEEDNKLSLEENNEEDNKLSLENNINEENNDTEEDNIDNLEIKV